MAGKKPFVLRIDPDKMEALEKWAADEFRSINGQLEWIIDRALRDSGRLPKRKKEDPHIKPSEDDNKI
jgi:hypothetical protein